MTDLRKAAEMALEALENHSGNYKLSKTECVHHNAAVEALRQALAQPEQPRCPRCGKVNPAEIHTCSPQVAQPEPVAWLSSPNFIEHETVEGKPRRVWFECNAGVGTPLYTAPPSKPWVSLTDEEADILITLHAPPIHPDFNDDDDFIELVNAIEAKLKEKNA